MFLIVLVLDTIRLVWHRLVFCTHRSSDLMRFELCKSFLTNVFTSHKHRASTAEG